MRLVPFGLTEHAAGTHPLGRNQADISVLGRRGGGQAGEIQAKQR